MSSSSSSPAVIIKLLCVRVLSTSHHQQEINIVLHVLLLGAFTGRVYFKYSTRVRTEQPTRTITASGRYCVRNRNYSFIILFWYFQQLLTYTSCSAPIADDSINQPRYKNDPFFRVLTTIINLCDMY